MTKTDEPFDHYLERAIFDTVRYFDVFARPVTATQIWRSLVVDKGGKGVRWQGHHVPSFKQVRLALSESKWLGGRLASQWGYYCLQSSVKSSGAAVQRQVRRRLRRHALAQKKWKILRRTVKRLAWLPYIKMIGVTGSLALNNTRPESDLDVLVIVKRGRIWMVRLLMLLATQLAGKRRKHWDRQAPDKVCLNHFITDDNLVMPNEVRSLYTAMLYAHLAPVVGIDTYRLWLRDNEPWLKSFLMYPDVDWLPAWLMAPPPVDWLQAIKWWLENWLSEPIGELLERGAKAVQRRIIEQHAWLGKTGRVMVSDKELAFHPDSKEARVLSKFTEEYGQKALL